MVRPQPCPGAGRPSSARSARRGGVGRRASRRAPHALTLHVAARAAVRKVRVRGARREPARVARNPFIPVLSCGRTSTHARNSNSGREPQQPVHAPTRAPARTEAQPLSARRVRSARGSLPAAPSARIATHSGRARSLGERSEWLTRTCGRRARPSSSAPALLLNAGHTHTRTHTRTIAPQCLRRRWCRLPRSPSSSWPARGRTPGRTRFPHAAERRAARTWWCRGHCPSALRCSSRTACSVRGPRCDALPSGRPGAYQRLREAEVVDADGHLVAREEGPALRCKLIARAR